MASIVRKTRSANRSDAATLELPLGYPPAPEPAHYQSLAEELAAFREFGQATSKLITTFTGADGQACEVPTYVIEFWTA